MVEPRLHISILSRQAQALRDRAADNARCPEGLVRRAPERILAAVRRELRRAEAVCVQEAHLSRRGRERRDGSAVRVNVIGEDAIVVFLQQGEAASGEPVTDASWLAAL